MKRLLAVTLALLAGNLILLLLGPPQSESTPNPPARIGLIFDVGGRGDKSFNDAAFLGLTRAQQELSVAIQYIEPGEGADRESGIRLLAAQGFDLVIGVGFIFSDDTYQVAKEYPQTAFACVDYSKMGPHGLIPPPSNMVGLRFREEEGAFLVGALASLVSKTGVIGFVGGMDIPLIHRFEAGYTAGAKHVRPNTRVLAGYAGVTGDAFKNPGKGKEMALAQYGKGADIIFHASGSTGLGVFEAARSLSRLAIGVDADQWGEAPGHILTSMIKRVDVAVLETIRSVVQRSFKGGVRVLGLAEGGVDYVYDNNNRPWVNDEVRRQVEALRQEIGTGAIKVPRERAAP